VSWARAAALLAFASAAVSAYWLLGGTALLDTVGGQLEDWGRERSGAAVAALGVVVALKLLAGWLALSLDRPWRIRLAWVGGILLAVYGGALVLAGALVLVDVVHASTDTDLHALRWHVFFWDLWFFVWGVALFAAARRARTNLGH
jgi:uncharacterized protein DUF3995